MKKTTVSRWRKALEVLLLLTVICPLLIFLIMKTLSLVGFWAWLSESPYPEGWKKASFQGTVVSLEGQRSSSDSRPGYAIVDLGDGQTYRMPRRVGMSEAPFVGEEVRKTAGEVYFEFRIPDQTGAQEWQTMDVLDGPDGLGSFFMMFIVFFLVVGGVCSGAIGLYVMKRKRS